LRAFFLNLLDLFLEQIPSMLTEKVGNGFQSLVNSFKEGYACDTLSSSRVMKFHTRGIPEVKRNAFFMFDLVLSEPSTDPIHIMMDNASIHPTTAAIMEYRGLLADDETLPTWDRATANECGSLTQGVGGRIEG
jgi:hypothetical protein